MQNDSVVRVQARLQARPWRRCRGSRYESGRMDIGSQGDKPGRSVGAGKSKNRAVVHALEGWHLCYFDLSVRNFAIFALGVVLTLL